METQTRINIRSIANVAATRTEKRNGRDVMIVPSVTLPDDIIMNGILYPAAEIANSYETLNRTPAPFNHPTINGKFVSASDPEGINIGYVGAWNENARQVDGRVFLDKVIDVEVANRTADGKRLIDAINTGGEIHTSTGLLCNLENAAADEEYTHVARNIYFDHDAILLDDDGAATPDDGVGMMVNAQGAEISVVNSAIEWAERDLDWALGSVVDSLERIERAGVVDRLKGVLLDLIKGTSTTTPEPEEPDMADEKLFNELKDTVDGLVKSLPDMIANAVKPIVDAQNEAIANAKAKDDAEKETLVNKLVKGNVLKEEVANTLSLEALRALAPSAEPGSALNLINGKPSGEEADEFADVKLNDAIKGEAA